VERGFWWILVDLGGSGCGCLRGRLQQHILLFRSHYYLYLVLASEYASHQTPYKLAQGTRCHEWGVACIDRLRATGYPYRLLTQASGSMLQATGRLEPAKSLTASLQPA